MKPTVEDVVKAARELHSAVDKLPVELWNNDVKVAMPWLAKTLDDFEGVEQEVVAEKPKPWWKEEAWWILQGPYSWQCKECHHVFEAALPPDWCSNCGNPYGCPQCGPDEDCK